MRISELGVPVYSSLLTTGISLGKKTLSEMGQVLVMELIFSVIEGLKTPKR